MSERASERTSESQTLRDSERDSVRLNDRKSDSASCHDSKTLFDIVIATEIFHVHCFVILSMFM